MLSAQVKPPRVALGVDLRFAAGIGNKGTQDLVIEDVKGTQLIMVHMRTPQDSGETSFLLNPSQVDALGEMTAPPHEVISVKPGSYAPLRISLYKNLIDKCLSEGIFAVSFSYGDQHSTPVTVAVEFAPASVEPLLSILEDNDKDPWVRKEALRWLRRLQPDFAYDFTKPDSRPFRAWWDSVRDKPDAENRFRARKP